VCQVRLGFQEVSSVTRSLTIEEEVKLDLSISRTIQQSLVKCVRLGGNLGYVSFPGDVLYKRADRVHQPG
jgi:hypothetical protein